MRKGHGFRAIILLGILVFHDLAHGADYFVSPVGNDTGAGTSREAPWRSISKVNSTPFQPGDRILFQANESFSGNVRMGPESSGVEGKPVVLSSYGEGRARIQAGSESGITVESAGNIVISNLVVSGNGPTNNIGYGLLIDNRLSEFKRLENICVENVDVSGFGIFGILVSGKQAGFSHVRVVECDLHDNLRGGMEIAGRLSWDSPLYAHTDVEVRRCRAFHNLGDPNYTKNHSGSGMVVYQVDGGRIVECQAWGNGQFCHHGNGGVGIWSCASRGVVIERCESFSNRTSGGDGGGFDLDGGSIDCILQYNYSHDNDGPGLMAYTYPYASYADKGNVIRFNVSENDARKGTRYAGLWIRNDGNGMSGVKVYNNTVRAGSWCGKAAYVDGQGVEVELLNNILIGTGGALPVVVERPSATLRFANNLYWRSGEPFNIQWGDKLYSNLEDWQSETGQESIEKRSLAIFKDPGLRASDLIQSNLKTAWDAKLAGYQPLLDSVAIRGRRVEGRGSIEPMATKDILGREINSGLWPIGAVLPSISVQSKP